MNESGTDGARPRRRLPPGVWLLGSLVLVLAAVLWLAPPGPVERGVGWLANWRSLLLLAAVGAGSLTFVVALPVYLFSGKVERAQAAGDLVKGLLSFFVGVLTASLN